MKRYFKAVSLAVSMTTVFAVGSAHAAPTTHITPCSTDSVKVTNISVAGGPTVSTTSYSAVECAGSFSGNAIPLPGTQNGSNLGYYGDGLFNGAAAGGNGNSSFPNGIFYDQYSSVEQDLNHDGKMDPGWIYLGSWTPGVGFKTATIGTATDIVLSNWFTVTSNAKSTGGTWSFTPDANVVSRAASVLGNSLFDQFALSFMAGDRFAAYDFTGAQFGMPTSSNTIFNFSGTWDMSKTLLNNGGKAAALSHVDLYVRDPNVTVTKVPEPGTLALLGIAFGGMLYRRRQG